MSSGRAPPMFRVKQSRSKTMTTIETRMPTPEDIIAVQYRARQMRAETVAAGARAIGRGLRRLVERAASLFARPAGA
jgi:hypothetical protein